MKSSYKIIKGNPLLNDHTVVRYVKGRYVNDDGSIQGVAFLSRPIDNGCVSYNWLDFFQGTTEDKLRGIREIGNLTLARSAVFAELNVGIIRQKIQAQIPNADIVHDPVVQFGSIKQDESHCVMTDIPNKMEEGYELSDMEEAVGRIMSRNITNTHPAREPI